MLRLPYPFVPESGMEPVSAEEMIDFFNKLEKAAEGGVGARTDSFFRLAFVNLFCANCKVIYSSFIFM